MLYSFEDFSLDTARRELRRNGSLIALQPQVFDLLEYAIRNRERVVSKDELLAAVWNGRLVSESTLNTRINAARSAIGDNGEEQRLLRTVYGKGIRFVGAVCEEAETVRKLAAISQPVVAPRLSIIVLPFTSLGSEPDQQYFADGITEDLTTDLSRLADMFVISRNTAFTYWNKPIDAKQIGGELGVRYVLEGSVRRSGNQVRVNAQLIDAATAAHLWAERFDGDAGDLFALQDEITSRIAVALDLELVDAEAARATEHPETQDYILRGRAARLKPPSHENRAEAIDQFEQALALDQGSVAAQSWLSIALMARVLDNMAGTAAADILRAEDLAERALATSPRSSLAHFAKGQVLRALDRYGEAILEYETAVALNRNWADAYSNLGWCKFMIGSIEELIPAQEQAIRLSPRDPQIGLFYGRIGHGQLLQSRPGEAIIWYERARNANPAHATSRTFLAAAYALKGATERAAMELAEARGLSRNGRFSSIARLKAGGISWGSSGYWGVPKVRDLFEATYFAGLRKAGMPEE